MSKSIYIIGPTSSGKSDLAIAIAQKFNGEIIGCDSRQIYRHMNIGSGKESGQIKIRKSQNKITQKAYISGKIPHYMIDTHHPNTDFSAGKFVKKTRKIIADIHDREKIPIICGGTMFWAQSLLEGNTLAPVTPNPKLRKKLKNKSANQLLELLRKLDPERTDQIIKKGEMNNVVRIIRSIEIATELGMVPETTEPDYNMLSKENLIIAIEPSKKILQNCIRKRLNARIDAGMLEEVFNLHTIHKVAWTRLIAFGLEYKWCTLFLQGKITKNEFTQNLLQESFRYAKRQSTWMRRWERNGATIHRVSNINQASTIVKKFLA